MNKFIFIAVVSPLILYSSYGFTYDIEVECRLIRKNVQGMAEWAIEQRKICESAREIKACKNKVLSFINKFQEDKTTEYVAFLDTHPDTDMLTKSYLRLLTTMQVNAALLGLTSNKSVEQIMNYEYNQCLNGPSK